MESDLEEDIKLNSSHLEFDKWVSRAVLTSRSKVRQCRKRNSGTTRQVEAEKKIEKFFLDDWLLKGPSRHPLFRLFRVIIETTGIKLACRSNVEAHSFL